MRSLLLILVCASLVPIAAAGPAAEFGTLDGSGGCDGSSQFDGGWNDSEGHSWSSWSSTRSCSDDFEYAHASASDANGEVASASLGTSSANTTNHSSSRDSWSGDGWSQRVENGQSADGHEDARTASADTRAGGAVVSTGCADERAGEAADWSYWSTDHDGNGTYTSSGGGAGWSSSSSRNDCTTGAATQMAGTPASFGAGNGCESTYDDQGWWNGREDYYSYTNYRSSDSSCANGAGAAAEGESVWAGLVSECAQRDDSWGSWQDGEGNGTSSSSSYHRSFCMGGVVVQGPDGILVFVGASQHSIDSCSANDCANFSQNAVVTTVAWQHNPLGPGPVNIWLPIP